MDITSTFDKKGKSFCTHKFEYNELGNEKPIEGIHATYGFQSYATSTEFAEAFDVLRMEWSLVRFRFYKNKT